MKLKTAPYVALSLVGSAGLGLFAPSARALPDPAAGIPAALAQKIAGNPALAGSTILGDHKKRNVLYVGPASKQSSAGGFAFTDFVGDCEVVKAVFEMTYLVPSAPSSEWNRVAMEGPVSPFFDYHFGESVRQTAALQKISRLIIDADSIREQNLALFSRYESTKEAVERSQANLDRARAEIEALNAEVKNASELVATATTPEDRQLLLDSLERAREERTLRMPELRDALKAAQDELKVAVAPYAEAKGAVAPLLGKVEDVLSRKDALEKIYEASNAVLRNAYERSQTAVTKITTAPVGIAGASYNIYGNEVEALGTALQSMNDAERKAMETSLGVPFDQIQVVRLPLYNVKLDMGHLTQTTVTADGSGAAPATARSVNISRSSLSVAPLLPQPDGELAANGEVDANDSSAFKDKNGKPLRRRVVQFTNEASGAVQTIVTRGAYCMTNPSGQKKTFSVNDQAGGVTEMQGYAFEQRPKANLLFQPIALRYEYFAKAEPMSVSCSMDINRFNSYTRNSGSSGWFFSRRSWDDTTRNLVSNNGVVCKVSDAPGMLNPEEQITWKNEIYQAMAQEVMAEYTLQFAAKWDLLSGQEVKVPPTTHKILGPSFMALCGGNTYCQIGNIVWKSAETLFGSQSGRTSTTDSLSGSIFREYREDGARLIPGAVEMNLSVTAPE